MKNKQKLRKVRMWCRTWNVLNSLWRGWNTVGLWGYDGTRETMIPAVTKLKTQTTGERMTWEWSFRRDTIRPLLGCLINRVSVLWWDWHPFAALFKRSGEHSQWIKAPDRLPPHDAWHMLDNPDPNNGSAWWVCLHAAVRHQSNRETLNSHPYA